MQKLWEALRGKKSYIVALATIIYAVLVIGWGGGDWTAAGAMILGALGLGGLRHAAAGLATEDD